MRKLEASIATSSAVLKRARAVVLRQQRPLLYSFRSWAHALLRTRALERWRREISERVRWHRGRRAAMAWLQIAAKRRYVNSRLSSAHRIFSTRRTRGLLTNHFGHWAALCVLLARLRFMCARSALPMQSFASWNSLTGTRGGWGKGGRRGKRRRKGLMISALESKCSRRVLRGWLGAWGAWALRQRRVTLAQGKTVQRRWRHDTRNVLRHWQQDVDVGRQLARIVDKAQRLLVRHLFSKVPRIVALDSAYTRALTFENFCAGERAIWSTTHFRNCPYTLGHTPENSFCCGALRALRGKWRLLQRFWGGAEGVLMRGVCWHGLGFRV